MRENCYLLLAIRAKAVQEKTGLEPDDVIRYIVAASMFPKATLYELQEFTGVPCRKLKRIRNIYHIIRRVI